MLLTYTLRKKELHKYKPVEATSRFRAAGCAQNEPNYKYTIFHDCSSFCMASKPVYGHDRLLAGQCSESKLNGCHFVAAKAAFGLGKISFALVWYWLNLVPNILSKSARFCICCELVQKKKHFSVHGQKSSPRVIFRNLKFWLLDCRFCNSKQFCSWCNFQRSRKVSDDQTDMCSIRACKLWQHHRWKVCRNVVTVLDVEL